MAPPGVSQLESARPSLLPAVSPRGARRSQEWRSVGKGLSCPRRPRARAFPTVRTGARLLAASGWARAAATQTRSPGQGTSPPNRDNPAPNAPGLPWRNRWARIHPRCAPHANLLSPLLREGKQRKGLSLRLTLYPWTGPTVPSILVPRRRGSGIAHDWPRNYHGEQRCGKKHAACCQFPFSSCPSGSETTEAQTLLLGERTPAPRGAEPEDARDVCTK